MAKPRIFVSSTFYDLKHARSEVEGFIRDMGYEPVLNEKGQITYGSSEGLENYCYKEIEKVSIVVSIIGNRFGSESRENSSYSISNMELRTALKQGKQVYVFVENGVLSEYRTYLKNKDKDISYHHVDDVRIYKFLEEIYLLPFNNQIYDFDSIQNVIRYLREQWAGLFEVYLQSQAQEKILQITDTIQSTAETLRDLVELLRNERLGLQTSVEVREQALDAIIIQNHPLFHKIRKLLNIRYRVFFATKIELEEWLFARKWQAITEFEWNKFGEIEYTQIRNDRKYTIYFAVSLFDDSGNLKPMLSEQWNENLFRIIWVKWPPKSDDNLDDDVPF